jgi:hypothetical protein
MMRHQESGQRFPTGKQAALIFFGILVLSFTTCMTIVVVWGERQVSGTEELLMGVAFFAATFAPLIGVVVVVMYFVRRRSNRKGAS